MRCDLKDQAARHWPAKVPSWRVQVRKRIDSDQLPVTPGRAARAVMLTGQAVVLAGVSSHAHPTKPERHGHSEGGAASPWAAWLAWMDQPWRS